MKRLTDLITPNLSVQFCENCILDASKGKLTRPKILEIVNNKEKYAEELRDILLKQNGKDFRPAPYKFEDRMENGKMRKLCKPQFWPDQCIHHALIKLILPNIKKRIDPYACSSIDGRGIDFGRKKLKHIIQNPNMREKTKYCLKMDIKKCFDSMKNKMIFSHIKRIVGDERWLTIFYRVIMNHDTLPIGLYISSWVLNLILKPLDEMIRAHKACNFYIRYMDDMVVLSHSTRKLWHLQGAISRMLWSEYGLLMKENWRIFLVGNPSMGKFQNGVDMLGFRFFRDRVILRKKNFNRLRKDYFKIKKLRGKGKKVPISVYQSYVSRCAHRNHVTNHTLNRNYIFDSNLEKIIDEISIEARRKVGGGVPKNMPALFKVMMREEIKQGKIDIGPSRDRINKRKLEEERRERLVYLNTEYFKCRTVMDFERLMIKFYKPKITNEYMNYLKDPDIIIREEFERQYRPPELITYEIYHANDTGPKRCFEDLIKIDTPVETKEELFNRRGYNSCFPLLPRGVMAKMAKKKQAFINYLEQLPKQEPKHIKGAKYNYFGEPSFDVMTTDGEYFNHVGWYDYQ